ncbi:MAG: GPGG-motif small membrane protein [Actinomycetota bacterium]
MEFLLWLIAVGHVISGIVDLVRGVVAWGLLLVIFGFLVGPAV